MMQLSRLILSLSPVCVTIIRLVSLLEEVVVIVNNVDTGKSILNLIIFLGDNNNIAPRRDIE